MSDKPKLAFYWAASCGGCEISVTELGMELVAVSEKADIVFWPAAMDYKYEDLRAMPDKSIDITFFNGGIRNSENEEMAHLFRQKTKILVAFGSCSHLGGIPGLANMYDIESMCQRVFDQAPSLDESRGTRPQLVTQMPEGEIRIPQLYPSLKTLAMVTDVDYFMPGCPPVVSQIARVFDIALKGELPPKGSVIGVDPKNNCDLCARIKAEPGFKVKEFHRPHEVELDPNKCFLTQGIICCGPATRGGCGLPCLNGNMPCRGCYGPPDGVIDQGAKLASAIAAIIDTDDPVQMERTLSSISDITGTFYRFSLADSVLNQIKYSKGALK
ncbi:MAG: F420-nonreducing hydrogenase [Anaerolineaceae bacterium]